MIRAARAGRIGIGGRWARFDYSSIDGKYVTNAVMSLSNLAGGAPYNYTISLYHATAASYAGAKQGAVLASAASGSSVSSSSPTLTYSYNTWVSSSTSPPPIGFVGLENAGQYSFQQFNAYQLVLTYDELPEHGHQPGHYPGHRLHDGVSAAVGEHHHPHVEGESV